MNIQIFGKGKCFDSKKAERYFKERRIKFQYVDLLRFGLSGKEFDSVLHAVGGIDNLIDWSSKSEAVTMMKYMDDKNSIKIAQGFPTIQIKDGVALKDVNQFIMKKTSEFDRDIIYNLKLGLKESFGFAVAFSRK